MKRLLALSALLALLLSSAAYAEKFTKFPAYGVCTGNNVRCREEPGTKSRVVDHINRGHEVQVWSQRSVGGSLWYEVELFPNDEYDEAHVWVAAQYIEPEH